MKIIQDNSRDLYFIAIIPPLPLREEIRVVKERILDRFGAGHALKSPAHITLQMPFKRSSSGEEMISAELRRFAMAERGFRVIADGYGAFPPRVIYIKIADPDPVRTLHRRLREILLSELDFSHEEIMEELQPHITVATRDLARSAFSEAWPEFRDEKFTGEFWVSSIFLLKHNGRNWDIHEEYPFGDQ
jgi:2'-5' RNA ligase